MATHLTILWSPVRSGGERSMGNGNCVAIIITVHLARIVIDFCGIAVCAVDGPQIFYGKSHSRCLRFADRLRI